MKCIIGLGNIGKEYENTRHNTGFMCVEHLAKKYNVEFNKKLKKSIYGETLVTLKNGNAEKLVFAKPTTYMNLSGEAVVEIMQWFKLSLDDILIIYDDIDLKMAQVRYRLCGSAGTHNGMRNILGMIKTEQLARIRVGIEAREEQSKIELMNYVTSKYNKEEIEVLSEAYNTVDTYFVEFIEKD